MAGAGTFRKGVMWVGVLMLLVGGFGSLLGGTVTATNIMAISLASALMLLDREGRAVASTDRNEIGAALPEFVPADPFDPETFNRRFFPE